MSRSSVRLRSLAPFSAAAANALSSTLRDEPSQAQTRLNRTAACMAVDGSTMGMFQAYAEYVLVPCLRPGDIVILDNLASHKDKTALELIRQAGSEVRFLPPYSPDLNPIEKMWSKIKQILRSIKARTQDASLAAIAAAWSASAQKTPWGGLPRAAIDQIKML